MIYTQVINGDPFSGVLNPHLIYAAVLSTPPNVSVEGFIFDKETGFALFDSVTGLPIAI